MTKHYKDDAAFCLTYPAVLKVEGGFVDDPADPGGPTNHGIAWNYNADALKAIGITRDTMRKLTKEQALQIYYWKYWLASNADGITDEGLAYIHFDCAVNCGVGAAAGILKKLSVNPKHFDGRGDNNETLFLRLVFEYEIWRFEYYIKNCSKRLKKEYLEGWVNRMIFVGRHALTLV